MTDKEGIILNLKEDVLEDFIDSEYLENDRFHVSMHRIVDNWAGSLSFEDGLDFLKQFDVCDFEKLDSGLYEEVLKKEGFEKLVIVLAYCLAEQELYNDEFLNSLQNWESEDDKKSKQLIEKAKEKLKEIK